jgi:hypothetical protein
MLCEMVTAEGNLATGCMLTHGAPSACGIIMTHTCCTPTPHPPHTLPHLPHLPPIIPTIAPPITISPPLHMYRSPHLPPPPPHHPARCAKFRFKPLHEAIMTDRVQYICSKEQVTLSPEAMQALGAVSGGDLRKAITTLQSAVKLKGPVVDRWAAAGAAEAAAAAAHT